MAKEETKSTVTSACPTGSLRHHSLDVWTGKPLPVQARTMPCSNKQGNKGTTKVQSHQHIIPNFLQTFLHANSHFVVLPSHPTPYRCSPSRMGKASKRCNSGQQNCGSAMTAKRLAFLDKERSNARWQLTGTRAGSQASRKRWTSQPDKPCPTTSSEGFPTLCSSRSSASKGASCPKSTISLRKLGSLLMRKTKSSPCGPYSLAVSQQLVAKRIPTTSQGSRKGHILPQQGPSQTFCRLFVFTLLTSIRPRARAKTAKTCEPQSLITMHLLQQVHPHSVSQHSSAFARAAIGLLK